MIIYRQHQPFLTNTDCTLTTIVVYYRRLSERACGVHMLMNINFFMKTSPIVRCGLRFHSTIGSINRFSSLKQLAFPTTPQNNYGTCYWIALIESQSRWVLVVVFSGQKDFRDIFAHGIFALSLHQKLRTPYNYSVFRFVFIKEIFHFFFCYPHI